MNDLRDLFEGFGDKFFTDLEKAHAMFLEMKQHPDGFSPAFAFLFMAISACYLHGFALVGKQDQPEGEPTPPEVESIPEMMATVSQIAEVLFENNGSWSNIEEVSATDIDPSEYDSYTDGYLH